MHSSSRPGIHLRSAALQLSCEEAPPSRPFASVKSCFLAELRQTCFCGKASHAAPECVPAAQRIVRQLQKSTRWRRRGAEAERRRGERDAFWQANGRPARVGAERVRPGMASSAARQCGSARDFTPREWQSLVGAVDRVEPVGVGSGRRKHERKERKEDRREEGAERVTEKKREEGQEGAQRRSGGRGRERTRAKKWWR